MLSELNISLSYEKTVISEPKPLHIKNQQILWWLYIKKNKAVL